MSSFNRVEIDKININWEEIYSNKSDAANNENNITANQQYWGDEEGLTAEIYDDGTVLIYEGDTPMGWTTLEALGLDENGNPLSVEFSDLSLDDIPDGGYVECTKEGIEGYAININGTVQFLDKNWFSTDENGRLLYLNGTKYIYINTNTGEAFTGLSANELTAKINNEEPIGTKYFTTPEGGITMTLIGTNGKLLTYPKKDVFEVDGQIYINTGTNNFMVLNENGTVGTVSSINIGGYDILCKNISQGTYNGEPVQIIGSATVDGEYTIITSEGVQTVPEGDVIIS